MERRPLTIFIMTLGVLALGPLVTATPTSLNGQSLLQERCSKCHGRAL